MIRVFLVALALWLFWSTTPAGAAVYERDWLAPGDGQLTYDDVNRREWLDLFESGLFQFPEPRLENAIAEIAPGGRFEGFTWATRDDVVALAISAGIDTSGFVLENEVATRGIIELLGATFDSPGVLHSEGMIRGTPSFPTPPGQSLRARFGVYGTAAFPGYPSGLRIGSADAVGWEGLMLYRVPEPTTTTIAPLGITFLIVVRRSELRRTKGSRSRIQPSPGITACAVAAATGAQSLRWRRRIKA